MLQHAPQQKLRRLNDIVGAGLLSLYIICDWTSTCFENITRLSGIAVSGSIQQKLTFLAYRFAPVVDGIKCITAYHAGDKVWAEYDLLLPEKMPLGWAHDIAETLQYCCEGGQADDEHGLSDILQAWMKWIVHL